MKKIILSLSVILILSTTSLLSQTLQQVVNNGNTTSTSITHTNMNGFTLKNNNIPDSTFNALRIGQYGGSAQQIRFVPYSTGGLSWDWSHDLIYDFTNTHWIVDGNFIALDNLGIGTTSPATKLHVWGGSSSFPQVRIHESGGLLSMDLGHDGENSIFESNFGDFLFRYGNIGIGTESPDELIHMSSGTSGDAVLKLESDTDNNAEGDNSRIEMLQDGGAHGATIGFNLDWSGTEPDNLFRIVPRRSSTDKDDAFIIKTTGSTGNIESFVGIGTTDPTNALEVNGTIRSKEVIVEATGWPDFVFLPEYNLLSLEELEAFISTNKHLPDVPNEAEVEENGIKLGEMDATLLKKIEELTLYVIEQNKLNKEQQERIEKLEKMNAELLKKLEGK
ncbi:MAG: hypothetical protein ED557_03630 [Balneola sp.]|nr:MAG: hypothetical protein ED557_03630 [Balneola sp.]